MKYTMEKGPVEDIENNFTMNLVASLFKYAYRLLDISNHQLLIVVENSLGDRFWSGSGMLRNEFINVGSLEYRSWGMFELKGESIHPTPNRFAELHHERGATPNNLNAGKEIGQLKEEIIDDNLDDAKELQRSSDRSCDNGRRKDDERSSKSDDPDDINRKQKSSSHDRESGRRKTNRDHSFGIETARSRSRSRKYTREISRRSGRDESKSSSRDRKSSRHRGRNQAYSGLSDERRDNPIHVKNEQKDAKSESRESHRIRKVGRSDRNPKDLDLRNDRNLKPDPDMPKSSKPCGENSLQCYPVCKIEPTSTVTLAIKNESDSQDFHASRTVPLEPEVGQDPTSFSDVSIPTKCLCCGSKDCPIPKMDPTSFSDVSIPIKCLCCGSVDCPIPKMNSRKRRERLRKISGLMHKHRQKLSGAQRRKIAKRRELENEIKVEERKEKGQEGGGEGNETED